MDSETFRDCLTKLRRHPRWLELSTTENRPPTWLMALRHAPLKLGTEQLEILRRLGFSFGYPDNLWLDAYLELWKFHQKHGHCRFHSGSARKNRYMIHWMSRQRILYRLDQLAPHRIRALNKLHFVWNPSRAFWQDRIEDLRRFIAQNGHANPRGGHNGAFRIWITNIRKRRSQLAPEQRRQLNRLGFVWQSRAAEWQQGITQLLQFRRRFGHINLPARSKTYPEAAQLLQTAKAKYRRGKLPTAQIRQLGALGVDWSPAQTLWHRRLQELADTYRRLGHTNLPKGWPENKTLERWARRQRECFSQLSPRKKLMLLKIGFDPSPGKPVSKGHSPRGKS
jgi:hypothetical protein